ncbi:MAG: hypothetical protein H0U58_10070, partial [Chloroflexi bacterium]|nr:hypothetical protein [Chloroflexota bacterium]
FRADHFLFHAMSRDITAFRSGDGPDGLGWNAEAVERIAITWDEASALAGRAAYYDRTGALRDMVQSHLLQYLALLVSDGPSRSGASRSAEKAAVLDRLRPWSTPDHERAVFARYTAGRTRDGQVGAYLDEAGVDAGRSTETFVSLTLELDHRDWIGVPFRLRSGKALGTGERAVEIVLRGAAKPPWRPLPAGANRAIRFEMASPGVAIEVVRDRTGVRSRRRLEVGETTAGLPASAWLLRAVLAKDHRLALSSAEIASSWRLIDAIRDRWRSAGSALYDYPAGSTGPDIEGQPTASEDDP